MTSIYHPQMQHVTRNVLLVVSVLPRLRKDARKQVQGGRVIPGAWALCSPSVATAADWIF